MSGLYPSIIFHFTSKEGLFGILEENFKLSYALECVEDPSENTVFGVPMVSFCDLRRQSLGSIWRIITSMESALEGMGKLAGVKPRTLRKQEQRFYSWLHGRSEGNLPAA
jgi:hypothetical protein